MKGRIVMKTFQIMNDRHQLKISKLIFGTTYIGNIEQQQAFEQMDTYYRLGGRCIDTARIYSNLEPTDKRPSEEVIGEWMEKHHLRQEIVISTKGGHPPYGDMNASRLTKRELETDLQQSLQALKTDYIDLYWLHRDDENLPVGEIMETLHTFVKAGKVRCLGASNWSIDRIEQANQYAKEHQLTPFSASQIQWSLGKTTPKNMSDETLVCMNNENYTQYLKKQIPIFAFESQAKGLFSKLAQMPEAELPIKVKQRFLAADNRDINLAIASKVMKLAQQYQVSPAVISLAYITCNPLTAGAIIGCSNTKQLEDSMKAADFDLSENEVNWLGD